MKLQGRDRRVQKYLDRQLCAPAYRWGDLTDPRDPRGRRWTLPQLIDAALLGQLAGCPTLRDVEAMTEEMGPCGRKYVSRRVPDSTLWELLPRLAVEEMGAKLHAQVRSAWRQKSLLPAGLPCGVVAIDGKGLGALEHDADGTAQKGHRSDGSPFWLARSLRAVLTSAQARPCIHQMQIGARTNEIGCAYDFLQELLTAYGALDLFEIVTVDAGIVSRAFADAICAGDRAYVMALKGTQPELLAEAKRLLDGRTTPDAETAWEVYRGAKVRRRLFRTDEIAGYHDWSHLRQAWLVVQETRFLDGRVEVESRYFLTSLRIGRLSPMQILAVVRGHWGIENDCFWTLDTQWKEDAVPWCSSGRAVEVLSWLRLMAYNLLQHARRRHLRRRFADGKIEPPSPWRRIFAWVQQALRLSLAPMEPVPVCG
jgi:Transposase DDE domain